jgi:carbonic anhydrase
MKPFAIFILFILTAFVEQSCKNKTTAIKPDEPATATGPALITSAEELKALSPDTILQRLKNGNKRFIENNVTARDHSKLVMATATAQFPKSVVLSCLDSRIPVEDVFDKGIGDMFVARNAGSIINEDVLGSMEYACRVSGAKLIVVMGHSGCGAIKSAIDNVKLGNITSMLAKIRPAIKMSKEFAGEKKSKNSEYTDFVGKNNVLHSIELVKKKSPVLKAMLEDQEIKIVGAYYDIRTGKVEFLE